MAAPQPPPTAVTPFQLLQPQLERSGGTVTPNDGTEDGYTDLDSVTIDDGCYFSGCDEVTDLGNDAYGLCDPAGNDPLGRYTLTQDF